MISSEPLNSADDDQAADSMRDRELSNGTIDQDSSNNAGLYSIPASAASNSADRMIINVTRNKRHIESLQKEPSKKTRSRR